MDKPVAIRIEEAKRELVACVNRQEINPSIMRYILREVLGMVEQAAGAEYDRDAAAWQAETDKEGAE